MYPNQPNQLPTPQQPAQQPPQPAPLPGYTADTGYLDSIAAPVPVKTMNPWQLWGIIGAVLLLMIIVVVMVSSGGSSNAERYTAYLTRVQALERLTKDSSKAIQSSQLRALNASTNSNLTTADTDGVKLLGVYDLKKLPEAKKSNPITNEYSILSTKLNDARLNSIYDRVYAREIGYQLGALRAEINTLYKATKNKQVRTYLETTDSNLKPLVTQLNEFNNSQS